MKMANTSKPQKKAAKKSPAKAKAKAKAKPSEKPPLEVLRESTQSLSDTLSPFNRPLTPPEPDMKADWNLLEINAGVVQEFHRQKMAATIDLYRDALVEATESAESLKAHQAAALKLQQESRVVIDTVRAEVEEELSAHYSIEQFKPAPPSAASAKFGQLINQSRQMQDALQVQRQVNTNVDRSSSLLRGYVNLRKELEGRLLDIAERGSLTEPGSAGSNRPGDWRINSQPLFRGA